MKYESCRRWVVSALKKIGYKYPVVYYTTLDNDINILCTLGVYSSDDFEGSLKINITNDNKIICSDKSLEEKLNKHLRLEIFFMTSQEWQKLIKEAFDFYNKLLGENANKNLHFKPNMFWTLAGTYYTFDYKMKHVAVTRDGQLVCDDPQLYKIIKNYEKLQILK